MAENIVLVALALVSLVFVIIFVVSGDDGKFFIALVVMGISITTLVMRGAAREAKKEKDRNTHKRLLTGDASPEEEEEFELRSAAEERAAGLAAERAAQRDENEAAEL